MKKSLLLTFVLAASMLLAQAAPATAAPAPAGRIPLAPVLLDEVVEYYGRLGDIQGPIGVVVEFEKEPAALLYAQAREGFMSAQALGTTTQAQVSAIQSEQKQFASALSRKGIKVQELYRTQRVYNGIWLYVDADKVAELAKMPNVKALHPMKPKEVDHTTSVPLIGALQAWAGSGQYQGQGVKVGIIDTGIDYIHTDFGGNGVYTGQDFTTLGETGNLFPTAKVVGGYDFAGDTYNADSTSAGYNPVPTPDPDPMDCAGHGSHVAGTVAGFGVLPNGSTYVESLGDTYADLASLSANDYMNKFRIGPGVAPKAELYSLRVFGCAGTTDLVELAIEWAMDPNNDGNLADHLDVINMSLGSSFGSEYDTSAIASNAAAQAGVIVVASAGNSADVYYITGSPAVASGAISVASSQDLSSKLLAFEVTASSNASLIKSYPAGSADFGPTTFSVTADAALAAPYDACADLTNPGAIAGKIAVITRGTCSFASKAAKAEAAGAVGVLVVNNAAGAPAGMAGDGTVVTIPAMMASQADGNAIKAVLDASGTVTIKLDSAASLTILDPTIVDTISSFSSRGIARVTQNIKPDITAPGDTIYSVSVLSGNKGANMSGTSMAAPHMSGVMALLRQQHDDWSVNELKALAMNTATSDITVNTLKRTPSLVGAGRVNIPNALGSSVIAYNTAKPELVSLPFGVVKVTGTQTLTKSFTVANKGATSETYDLTFDLRYQANPGIVFSLEDGSGNPLTSVTVPAGGTTSVTVKVALDASQLDKTLDPTVALGARSRMGESGGLVVLTSTGSAPTLRVPVHIAARAASTMSVPENKLVLPAAATGTVSLHPTGSPVALPNDASLAYIFELLGESPAQPTLVGKPAASADLQYVGVTRVGNSVYFGISTYGDWDTLYGTEFDIYIDSDKDGDPDYIVYNYDTGSARNDTLATRVVNLATNAVAVNSYINGFSGATNTNVFNNNVVVLPVSLSAIGLDATNTDFDFFIATFHADAPGRIDLSDDYHYDTAKQAFSTGLVWDDNAALEPTFDIDYNKAYITNDTKGLLVLHTHNAENSAQVVAFTDYIVTFDSQGGSPVAPQIVAVGNKVIEPAAPTRFGYIFEGWYDAPSGGALWDFDTAPTGSLTLYAQWSTAETTYLPMLFKKAFDGSYSAAFYIQSISNVETTVNIYFYSDTGSPICTITDTIAPLASKGWWTPSLNCLPDGWVGGAYIQSSEQVIAVARPHIGNEVMAYNGFITSKQESYLSMLFKKSFDGSYNAAFYVQNVDAIPASITIKFYNEDGTTACTLTDTIAPLASKGWWTPGVSCLPNGWVGNAVVTSDTNIVTVGRPHVGPQITTYSGFSIP